MGSVVHSGGLAKGLTLPSHPDWFPLPRLHFLYLSLRSTPGLLIHPVIQPRLLEPPAVPQLECRNEVLRGVFIERIRADAQVFGGLLYVHDFPNLSARKRCFHRRLSQKWIIYARAGQMTRPCAYTCFRVFIQEVSVNHRFAWGFIPETLAISPVSGQTVPNLVPFPADLM